VKDQIWLIGFMGTGKSRVARPLAAALDWEAKDLDRLIEADAGERVREIFGRGGEAAFRTLESAAVERVAEMHNVVVATGGGAVIAEANRRVMRTNGFIVCLDARPETIVARLRQAPDRISDRPLLAGRDPLAQIIELKAQRQPLYAEADFIIQTDDMTPDQITHQILSAFRAQATVGASEPT
jgi:shikimate kinase